MLPAHPDDDIHPTVEQITKVEEWVLKALTIDKKDSLWECQMAITLSYFHYSSDAEKRCRQALTLDGCNWRASHTLAKVLESKKDAVQILEEVTERLGADKTWMVIPGNKETLSTMLHDMAKMYWEMERFDVAILTYKRGIKEDPSNLDQIYKALVDLHDGKRWQDSIEILEIIGKMSDSTTQPLVDTIVGFSYSDHFHNILRHAAIGADRCDLLESLYEESISSARGKEMFTQVYLLRCEYGRLQYHRLGHEDKAVSLWEHAMNHDLPLSDLSSELWLSPMIERLGPIYLRRARAAEPHSETAQHYLRKLNGFLEIEEVDRNSLYLAALYLARYYHDQGDEIKAKEVARSTVKLALEMLSDDDPENDYTAYSRLRQVFMPLDDDANVYAAWIMLTFAYQSQFIPVNQVKRRINFQKNDISKKALRELRYEFYEKVCQSDASLQNALS